MTDNALAEIEEIFMNELGDLENGHQRVKTLMIKFRERFAKGSLYIAFDYNHRNKQIIEMSNQGKTARQIAMTFQLSTRQVSKILSKTAP